MKSLGSKILIGIVTLGALAVFASNQSNTQPMPQSQKASPVSIPTKPVTVQPPQTPPVPIIFRDTLSIGSSGTTVANVQQFLADEGFYTGRDTGVFEQTTAKAVIAFQQQENISPADGVFGRTEQTHANAIIATHPDWLTNLSNGNEYLNVNGSTVHSPSYSTNGIPAGASAVCRDGTYSFSMHRSGTCSHHGGVASWL